MFKSMFIPDYIMLNWWAKLDICRAPLVFVSWQESLPIEKSAKMLKFEVFEGFAKIKISTVQKAIRINPLKIKDHTLVPKK